MRGYSLASISEITSLNLNIRFGASYLNKTPQAHYSSIKPGSRVWWKTEVVTLRACMVVGLCPHNSTVRPLSKPCWPWFGEDGQAYRISSVKWQQQPGLGPPSDSACSRLTRLTERDGDPPSNCLQCMVWYDIVWYDIRWDDWGYCSTVRCALWSVEWDQMTWQLGYRVQCMHVNGRSWQLPATCHANYPTPNN